MIIDRVCCQREWRVVLPPALATFVSARADSEPCYINMQAGTSALASFGIIDPKISKATGVNGLAGHCVR